MPLFVGTPDNCGETCIGYHYLSIRLGVYPGTETVLRRSAQLVSEPVMAKV